MKNYSKAFKLLMWILIVISVILLVGGFIVDFESNGGMPVDILLYWAYAMIGIAAIAVIVIGAIIGFKNDKKSILRLGIGIVAVAAICFVAYLLAPGNPAVGMLEQPDQSTLRLTDAILNLTYFAGGLAILAIIFGEILMSIRGKKQK